MTTDRPDIWIFVDWDETITDHDTLALIPPPDSTDLNGPPPFSFFSEYYVKLVAEHEKEFGPRDTLERQLEYLDSMTSVENASVSKLEEHELFKGVMAEDLHERGKQVRFRDGWEEFTKQVAEHPNARLIGILSVNWSAEFIEGALRRIHDDKFMEQLEIRANNIEMDREGKGTGKLTKRGEGGIRTGHDKLREMRKLLEKNRHSNGTVTIYVGDSNTDLPCLLFADIGIIIGEGRSLVETCKRVGVEVINNARLNEIVMRSSEVKGSARKQLYQFQNWHKILDAGLLY